MKKPLFLWALYDFANSFVLMGFLFCFSQWLVVDQGKPAWWYNAALIVSSALFVLTAPALSRQIDAGGKKLAGLRIWTFFAFSGFLAVSLLTMLTNGAEAIATLLYTLATYAYLMCFLYFTPMLNDLSTHDDRAWKSGLGQGANSLGQVVGVLAILPFVNGLTLFGDPGRAQGLLPATILFGLLALPMLLWYRENTSSTSQHPLQSWSLAAMAKEVFGYRALALLLVAYFLFSDAVITFANNFPLYLEVVHGATDTLKSTLTAAILLLAAIGAVVFGKIAQQKGTLRVLKGILAAWCLIFLAMIFIKDFTALVPVFLVAGILFGPVWALSRALVGQLAPPHLTASSFSYYVIAERFATFAGPALWSAALLMVGENVAGYNTAIFAMAILVLASLLVLRKVQLN